MSIPADYFYRMFSSENYRRQSKQSQAEIDYGRIGKRLDVAQAALDAQVWNDMRQYMPHDTGALIGDTTRLNMSVHGEVYAYPPNSDYGHYQYEGKVYVDPVSGKGAMYSPDYGFWSRPGIEKIPSDRHLQYTQPNAREHWDEVAYKKHKEEWVNLVARVVGGVRIQ